MKTRKQIHSLANNVPCEMTLRDWFAGMFLDGVVSSAALSDENTNNDVAKTCYKMADAMMRARDKASK